MLANFIKNLPKLSFDTSSSIFADFRLQYLDLFQK